MLRSEHEPRPARARTSRDGDLWDIDDRPCERAGTLETPNPSYIAGFPVTADAFLAKVRTDSAAIPDTGDPSETEMDDVLRVLRTTWLTDAQRVAGIEALAQITGPWRFSGHERVAGIDGVLLLREEGINSGTRDEMVVAAQTPGVLRTSTVLTDPARAVAGTMDRAKGLPVGTVIFDDRVTVIATVPDRETTP